MSSRTVVCTFFKLPLDQQPLCRLTDIAEMFPAPLDYLNLVVSATDPYGFLSGPYGHKHEINNLRSEAADLLQTFLSVTTIIKKFITISLKLVDLLATGAPEVEVTRQVGSLTSQAAANAQELDKAHGKAFWVSLKIAQASDKLKDVSRAHYARLGIGASEICDILEDMKRVVEECKTLFDEYNQYFKETQTHYSNDHLDPPSQEEMNLVRERLSSLSKSVVSSKKVLSRAHRRLKEGPKIYSKYDTSVPSTCSEESAFSDSGDEEEEEEKEKISPTKCQKSSETRHTRQLFSGLKSKFRSWRNSGSHSKTVGVGR